MKRRDNLRGLCAVLEVGSKKIQLRGSYSIGGEW